MRLYLHKVYVIHHITTHRAFCKTLGRRVHYRKLGRHWSVGRALADITYYQRRADLNYRKESFRLGRSYARRLASRR